MPHYRRRRRRREADDPENHDRWLVSYADFITLLFAFFVVMYGISSIPSCSRFAAIRVPRRAPWSPPAMPKRS